PFHSGEQAVTLAPAQMTSGINFGDQPAQEKEPNDVLAQATPLALGGPVAGTLTPGDVDFFRVALTADGRLTVRLAPTGVGARVSLLGLDGTLLVQSDGETASDPDGLIIQNLLQGIYFLKVEPLGGGSGSYFLSTTFHQALNPLTPFSGSFGGEDSVTA